MKADWNIFFPPHADVLALPSWRNPRLYLSAGSLLRRWEASAMYPGSRSGARLYRGLLRLATAAGLKSRRTVGKGDWPLGEFVGETMPGLSSAVVLAGTPGPAQTATVKLLDGKGRVLGYLKYAETEAARRRIRQEHYMISSVPEEITPRPLKFGPMGKGEALLRRSVVGDLLPTTLPPADGVIPLLDSLTGPARARVEAHPWVRNVKSRGEFEIGPVLEALSDREWPVVIQHGDFAPWNLLRTPGGAIRAIDWECGTMEGFPHLDLCHYLLQVSFLIYRRKPSRAARFAVEYLSGQPHLALNGAEAAALVRLTACNVCQRLAEDGRYASSPPKTWSLARRPTGEESRAWWLSVWEG